MNNKQRINKSAKALIRDAGIINLTMDGVCQHAGVPVGSFQCVMDQTFVQFRDSLKPYAAKNDPKNTTVTRSRVDGELRRIQIVDKAMDLSKKIGCHMLTRPMIATALKITGPTVSRYSGSMTALKRVVLKRAIDDNILEIIGRAVLQNDVYVCRKIDRNLRQKAVQSLAGK